LPGVVTLAGAIKDMEAILKFTFSGDHKPVTMETSMVEADFGGNDLDVHGAIIMMIMVAAFLPKCT
jgi:hypothetical protein